MTPPRLIEGDVIDVEDVGVSDERDVTIANLERDVDRLRSQLRVAEATASQAKHDAARALGALRQQLSPLYRALRMVFGELDAAGVDDDRPSPASGGGTDYASPKWLSWKQKMPGRPAEVIDLLLLHGEMTRNQLMAAMHAGKDVVRVTISRLHVAGLINKNGSKYSLKQL